MGDTKDGYLRGTTGEAHPHYHKTARKRVQADYRGGGQK
jgi:hypothetical protein